MRDVTRALQDLRYLSWSERANTSGTGGCFLKAKEETGSGTWYYKLSCYDSYRGIYGHECVNELIASRLMSFLGIEHVEYRLVHALITVDGKELETWVNRSRSFRKPVERKQAFDTFYDLHKEGEESPLELAKRYGWADRISQIMLLDYLIANRDRHGANVEVLQDRAGFCRLAPVFDCGLSLVFSCYEDVARARVFDPMTDVNANNYFGTRSLEENLRRFVPAQPASFGVTPLDKSSVEAAVKGLDSILPKEHCSKIKEMIWQRWCFYEALRVD